MTPEGTSGSDKSIAGRLRAAAAHRPALAVVAVVILLAGLTLVALSLSSTAAQPLYPRLPTFTPAASPIADEVAVVSFEELNADPALYRDREILVSGRFAPLDPDLCRAPAGPAISWSLVSDNLQLKAIGFEEVLRLVSPGTELTVRGVWQLYRGPVGCGKEPPTEAVWFLHVNRIVEPNPLFAGVTPGLTVIAPELPTLPPLEFEPTSTRVETPTEFPTPTETTAANPTETPLTETPSAESTPTLFPTVTPRPDLNATPGTPETTTPDSLTPGVSLTPSPTGTVITTPGTPTNTPASTGYPPPTNTPTGGYP